MEVDSPLQTKYLRRSSAWRRVISSDEKGRQFGQTDEAGIPSDSVGSRHSPSSRKRRTDEDSSAPAGQSVNQSLLTPDRRSVGSSLPAAVHHECNSKSSYSSQSARSTTSGTGKQVDTCSPPTSSAEEGGLQAPCDQATTQSKEASVDLSVDPGIIITMNYSEGSEDMAWDSELDGTASTTSTPAYKRGIHDSMDEVTRQAVKAIQKEASQFVLNGSARGPSVQVLADSKIMQWPRDSICVVNCHQDWDITKWLPSICAEIIRIQCNTVVLYFEKTQNYGDVPRLKNHLQAICKAIRQHQKGCCIFISNILPKASTSPVRRAETNFVLLQAVRSVNRCLGKIHFLSVYEHFVSK